MTKPAIAVFCFLPLLLTAQEVEDIRDVKDLVEIPSPPNYTLWICLFVAALIIGFLLWKFLRRTKKTPGIAAYVVALKELRRAEPLVNEESAEPLVVTTTDIIRKYIERRFSLAATRQTTEEFLREIHKRTDSGLASFQEELGEFLSSCDAVKFGRAEMESETRNNLLDSARQFINATRELQEVKS